MIYRALLLLLGGASALHTCHDNPNFYDIFSYGCTTSKAPYPYGNYPWAGWCGLSRAATPPMQSDSNAGYIQPGQCGTSLPSVDQYGTRCEVGGYVDGWTAFYTKAHMDEVRAECPASCNACAEFEPKMSNTAWNKGQAWNPRPKGAENRDAGAERRAAQDHKRRDQAEEQHAKQQARQAAQHP